MNANANCTVKLSFSTNKKMLKIESFRLRQTEVKSVESFAVYRMDKLLMKAPNHPREKVDLSKKNPILNVSVSLMM